MSAIVHPLPALEFPPFSLQYLAEHMTYLNFTNLGGGTSLDWTSGKIFSQNEQYLDVVFESSLGDFHWVIFPDLAGAYQYFVNKALPTLGEFRTLFRLDNTTFVNGKTAVKEGKLYLSTSSRFLESPVKN